MFRKLRQLLGYSQVEMAERLGTTKQNYQRLEKKALKIDCRDIKKIRALAREADVSDRELLELLETEGERLRKQK